MSELVTLELPEDLARRARALAAATRRSFEEAMIEWIGRAIDEFPVEGLADNALLTLCDATMEDARQESLSDLLARNREKTLDPSELDAIDALMNDYRQGFILKARALKEAVTRGLRVRPFCAEVANSGPSVTIGGLPPG